MNGRQALYDELCGVLTNYEGNGSDEGAVASDLYSMLVKIQIHWEDVITSNEEAARGATADYGDDPIITELEKARAKMLDAVNGRIDGLITRIENGEPIDHDSSVAETVYPLSISPALFKGTKPTAVFFGGEKAPVKTWLNVYALILRRCAEDQDKRDALKYLCNKISGRKRLILSDKPDGMNRPVEVTDGVFAEGFFDTEWLIRILTTELLDTVRYDYSGISVSVTAAKKRQY